MNRRSRHSIVLALALPAGAAAVAGGCAQILGIEDLPVPGDAGGASGPLDDAAAAEASPDAHEGAAPGCDAGFASCDGACVDPSKNGNCGGCGIVCASGAACLGSHCTCPVQEEACAKACVNTQSDVAHCGGCGHGCDAGPGETPVCSDGVCRRLSVLASNLEQPGGIGANGSVVVWANLGTNRPDSGSVMLAPLDGGAARTLAADVARPLGVAVSESHAYWVNFADPAACVNDVALPGGDVRVLAAPEGRAYCLGALAFDGTSLFYSTNNGGLRAVPSAGGQAATLQQDAGAPRGIAASAGRVFFSADKAIFSILTDGGSLTRLTPSLPGEPAAVAADSIGLAWLVPGFMNHGEVDTLFFDGGAATTPFTNVARGQALVTVALALDDTYVYWANAAGSILKAPRGGGPAVTLVTGQVPVAGLAVDDTGVAWTRNLSPNPGQVLRLTPK